TEEFFPVEPGVELALSTGATATTWTEWVRLRGASAVATFESGSLAGVPAITRNAFGGGSAWYLATNLDPASLRDVLATAAREAGVATRPASPDGVEIIRRAGPDSDFVFFINHTDAAFEATASGTELITDT